MIVLVQFHECRRHRVQLQHCVSPASVDDPEPRLIYCFVDVEEALVLQNAQRDKAERRNSEVSSVSDLFSEPMLHLIDQPDGLNRIVRSLSGQSDDERVGWEPVVLVEDSCAVVDDFLPFARTVSDISLISSGSAAAGAVVP